LNDGDGAGEEDPGSGIGVDDAAGPPLDLSPRTGSDLTPRAPRAARRTSPFVWVVLGVVLVGLAFVVIQGLNNATLYFRNADEAVAQRDELGTRRFRLQGLVVADADDDGDTVSFQVEFNEVVVPVESTDGLPSLFEPGRPVVLEGRFAEGDAVLFQADRILVKHDESYESENEDRLRDADDGHTDDDG
jgi:cytochrome c-type biogenesis protein CcmE